MIGRGRRARRRARRGHGPRRRRARDGAGTLVDAFVDTFVDTELQPASTASAPLLAPSPFTSSCSFESAPGPLGVPPWAGHAEGPARRERFVMTLNAPPPRPLEPEAFNDLVDAAARYRRGAAGPVALDAGVDLQGLCRFAAGALAAGERRQVEAQLATTPWATTRVAALLRGARGAAHGGLGRGDLEAARRGPVDAAREVGAALVREAGEDGGDPRARAGAALGAGRHDEAHAALSEVQSPTPLVELARRVAQLERDPDMALCELLSAI